MNYLLFKFPIAWILEEMEHTVPTSLFAKENMQVTQTGEKEVEGLQVALSLAIFSLPSHHQQSRAL